jgi:hypothetical protein
MSNGRVARILEVTSYRPPRAGWGIRVELLKKASVDVPDTLTKEIELFAFHA